MKTKEAIKIVRKAADAVGDLELEKYKRISVEYGFASMHAARAIDALEKLVKQLESCTDVEEK